MKLLVPVLFVLLSFALPVFAQNDLSELKTVELVSNLNLSGVNLKVISIRNNCFSFITERIGCENIADISYGNMRVGNDWDWFRVRGTGSRNKIKSLGQQNWTDKFKIPVVEPYAKLNVGEQRNIVLPASGTNGRTVAPGSNGIPGRIGDDLINYDVLDGDRAANFETKDFHKDLLRENHTVPRKKAKSGYQPFEKAILGHMYVMRVVDEKNDFYVLFRIDELEKGTKCKISWKRIDAPKDK